LIGPQCQYCGVKRHTLDVAIIFSGSQNARNACTMTIIVAKPPTRARYIPRLRVDSARKFVTIWVKP
jgi:hypothetical protein